MPSPLVNIQGLNISFGTTEVLSDFNLQIKEGEIVSVVGESGSGKSISALMSMGLLSSKASITSTHAEVLGRSVSALSTSDWLQLRGKEIAMVFQDPMTALHPSIRIGKQLEEVLEIHTDLGAAQRQDKVLRALEEVSIPPGKFETGKQWEYQSACTQLLTIALSRAIGESISSFANRELFAKVGFEVPTTWHLDRAGGFELGYCCLNAAVRDFAKLGMLVNNYGYIDSNSVIDSAFIAEAQVGYKSPYYGHSFWIYPDVEARNYSFRGLNGQLIIILPDYDMVIMRVGEKAGDRYEGDFRSIGRELIKQAERWQAN